MSKSYVVVGSIPGINCAVDKEYFLIFEYGIEIFISVITVLLFISAAGQVDGIGVLVTGSPVEGYGRYTRAVIIGIKDAINADLSE